MAACSSSIYLLDSIQPVLWYNPIHIQLEYIQSGCSGSGFWNRRNGFMVHLFYNSLFLFHYAICIGERWNLLSLLCIHGHSLLFLFISGSRNYRKDKRTNCQCLEWEDYPFWIPITWCQARHCLHSLPPHTA